MKRFTMHVPRARDSCTSYATETIDYLTEPGRDAIHMTNNKLSSHIPSRQGLASATAVVPKLTRSNSSVVSFQLSARVHSFARPASPPPLWRALRNFKFGTRIQPRLTATNCTQ